MSDTQWNRTNLLVVVAAFVVVVAGMKAAASLLIPFLLAIFIAIICAPMMTALTQRRVPAGLAVVLVMCGIVIVGAMIGSLMGASLRNFSQALPLYEAQLASKGVQFTTFLQSMGVEVPSNALTEYINPSAAMKMVASVFSGLGGVLTNTFLILFTVIFILTEASGFPHKLTLALGSPDTLQAFTRFSSSVKSYLAIKTAVSAATGVFISFWCWMFGVDYPVLWGLVAMLLNYVPNIGSIIAAVPAVLLALIQFGVGTSMFVMLGYVLVNVIMGNVIEPKFMGRSLGLSALVVFVSLVFWGWVLGPVGMLLSIPLTMIVKIALESNDDTRWIAILLDSDADLKKSEG